MPSPELSPSKPPPPVRPPARTETKINHRRAQRRVASTVTVLSKCKTPSGHGFPVRPSIATPGIRDGDTQIRTTGTSISIVDCGPRLFARARDRRVFLRFCNPDYRDVPRALAFSRSRSLALSRIRDGKLGPCLFFVFHTTRVSSLCVSLSRCEAIDI